MPSSSSILTLEDWDLFLKEYHAFRVVNPATHYETISKELRALFKEHIAFLYSIYREESFSTTLIESIYASNCLKKTYKKIEYFPLFLPSILSIPILLSLLVPAQILGIPSQIFFNDATPISALLHTALELLGIEEIYILPEEKCNIIFNKTKNNPLSKNVTSAMLLSEYTMWHYRAPKIYTTSLSSIHKTLYPDAHFGTLYKEHYDVSFDNIAENTLSSQYLKRNKEHLWYIPQITILQYYIIETQIL